jgi:S-adenosylmethionine:tRNA ribosyltransferase-isomerase
VTAHTPGTRVGDYDYELPPDRIASHPAEKRDESRLLVVEGGGASGDPAPDSGPEATGPSHPFRHLRFRDLPDLISPGDVLVVNESRVIPARLLGRKPTGAPSEVLLLRPALPPGSPPGTSSGMGAPHDPTLWEALVRPGGKLKPGRRVVVADDLEVVIVDSTGDGGRIVRLETPLPVDEALERHGHVPLPPYIDRDDEPGDRERYQTVYARERGSVAAPTAGLHFTPRLLSALEAKGVEVARVLLHVGIGTFRPLEIEDPRGHSLHREVYHVSAETSERVNRARAAGGRVWAVGTTVVRTLETVADEGGRLHSGSGETDLFIHPPYRFRAVDALITNFHLPRSSLLMLVAAFAGYERTMAAYREAIREGYRFYSYGDAMVVVPAD